VIIIIISKMTIWRAVCKSLVCGQVCKPHRSSFFC